MNVLMRIVRQPQRVWLRRAAFQVHLWIGIAIGLYVVMLSATGSILVYRIELDRALRTERPVSVPGREVLPRESLQASAERLYPGWTVTRVGERVSRRNPTIEISLEKDGVTRDRLFDPYTGADLGDAITRGERALLWLVRLHDELLLERDGKLWNAYGSILFTVLVLTGAIVWWPGIERWRRALGENLRSSWKRINFDLHSALGFWLFLFMLVWGLSGIYLGLPDPFLDFVDAVSDPNAEYGERWGDVALEWLPRLHFGRWRNDWLKAVWALAGMVPAVMFVTGVIMWWNRVVQPARRNAGATRDAATYAGE